MYENNNKGWFGAFSLAGKNSAENYRNIVYKDDILEEKSSKKRLFNRNGLFSAFDLDKIDIYKNNTKTKTKTKNNDMDELEDDINEIFLLRKQEKEEVQSDVHAHTSNSSPIANDNLRYSSSNSNITHFKSFSSIQENRMQYHNLNKQKGSKVKKQSYPECNKYNPKYSQVKPRLLIGPSWKKTKGHSFSIKTDDSKYYLDHEDLKTHAKKTFINLKMFSMRGDNVSSNNIRSQTTKVFKSKKSFISTRIKTGDSRPMTAVLSTSTNEQIKKKIKATATTHKLKISTRQTTSEAKGALTMTNNNILNTSSSSLSQSDSYSQYQHIYKKQFKKKRLLSPSNQINVLQSKKKKTKGPDFSKTMSREMLMSQGKKNERVIPFSLPNYSLTRERQIMMIVYDKNKHRTYKPKELKGVDNSNYDPYKVLNKVNNHISVRSPNFNLMQSRASDSSHLPSYMKKIHTKATSLLISEDSLKMNNYSEGKFLKNSSTFWPKKSYNKYVNLHLLNSGPFIDIVFGHQRTLSNQSTKNDYITRSMKFYTRNFEELFRECMISKFDNVTYKTTKKANKLDSKEVQNFIDNYNDTHKREAKI